MKNLKITVNGVAYDVQVEEVGSDGVSSAPSAPVAAAPKAPAATAATKAPVAGENVTRIEVFYAHAYLILLAVIMCVVSWLEGGAL